VFYRQASIVPPPDGDYPNFTTAEGQNALENLTTGAANTAVGCIHFLWTPVAASTLVLRWNACAQYRGRQYGHWRCSALAEHTARQHSQRNSHVGK